MFPMMDSSLDAPCTNYTLSPSMRERFRPVTTMPLVFLMPLGTTGSSLMIQR
nr:unnamed protein product [Callosobruchus chinensis]